MPKAKVKKVCSTEGCGRVVITTTGREKCRECHRLTVVWKSASNQRRNQCAGFAIPTTVIRKRVTQMSVKDAGAHVIDLLRRVVDMSIPGPVTVYSRGSDGFAELERMYSR